MTTEEVKDLSDGIYAIRGMPLIHLFVFNDKTERWIEHKTEFVPPLNLVASLIDARPITSLAYLIKTGEEPKSVLEKMKQKAKERDEAACHKE